MGAFFSVFFFFYLVFVVVFFVGFLSSSKEYLGASESLRADESLAAWGASSGTCGGGGGMAGRDLPAAGGCPGLQGSWGGERTYAVAMRVMRSWQKPGA